MLTVEIMSHHGSIVLRARNSELLILPQHVMAMKDLKDPRQFSEYFLKEALVNRPARKLFEAWLRKDRSIWPRLFKNVQTTEIPEEILEEIKKLNSKTEEPKKEAVEEPKKTEKTAKKAPAKKKATAKTSETKKKTTKTTKTTKKSTAKKATKKSTSTKKVTKKATEVKKKTTKKATKSKTKTTKKKS